MKGVSEVIKGAARCNRKARIPIAPQPIPKPGGGALLARLRRWSVRVSVALPLFYLVGSLCLLRTLGIRFYKWRYSSTHFIIKGH